MTGKHPASTALASVRNRVVVSCQAPPGNPMRSALVISRIASSVVAAGASGVRIDSPEHITAVKETVDAPVIGLWKAGSDGVYITPTLQHARAVVAAGADIVAVDGTGRPRPDGRDLGLVIRCLHAEFDAVVLADIGTVAEGIAAAACGADAVATTLAGLYAGPGHGAGPALEVVATLAASVDVPVIAEGGIGTPAEARAALEAGAWCVVIGKAITSPGWITARFVEACQRAGEPGGHPGEGGERLAARTASEPLAHPDGNQASHADDGNGRRRSSDSGPSRRGLGDGQAGR